MESRVDLIYDWNVEELGRYTQKYTIQFNDETLRDGLQSPSVRDPKIEEKIKILHLMEEIGIHALDLGLPGAGPRAKADVFALAKEIADKKMSILPNCAARTVISDIESIADISQQTGIPIEAATFIGSSVIRLYTEDWGMDKLLERTEEAVTFAVKHHLPVMYVTEDTTRAHPEMLRKLYLTAIRCGAHRLCLTDTVGHANPDGVRNLVAFIKTLVEESGEDVKIDWHGHNDRGLALPNALAAMVSGVDRVHGTANGIGERVGNLSMDQFLVNLKLMGVIDNDLTKLYEYCELVSRVTGIPIPINYPVMGKDAFRTATGVHAAAIIKAEKKGDRWLQDYVYSGVPAGEFGLEQRIEIGYMSGKSNVEYWLKKKGKEPNPVWIERIYLKAKQSDHILSEEEILSECSETK